MGRFREERGYGFISPSDEGQDVFGRNSGIEGAGFRSLDEGGKVTYEVTHGKRGLQAENVSNA